VQLKEEEHSMHFVVEDSFWQLFPDVTIGLVVARGFDNTLHADRTAVLLESAVDQAAVKLASVDIPSHPAIAPWRAAYAAFGVKPSKFRSSIESLLRAAQAGRLHAINPLVDLYNTVSLRHLLPCGGEDLAAIQGDIRLTRASGDEHFVALGAEREERPAPGEVIYCDEYGAICRCWNWREADRTKLTPSTSNAFLCIESVAPHARMQVEAACADLAALVVEYLGGTATTAVLSRATPLLTL
jgi:DNA/RNA-binding domain of Phe-tRNA-synthetase-like protein